MSWFSRKPKTGPLWDYLSTMTPEGSAATLDGQVDLAADDPALFLERIVFVVLLASGCSFLRSSGEFARDHMGKVNPDVIAFEGLAFSVYLVQESYMSTSDYWEYDDESETIADAFHSAIVMMPHLVMKHTGWEVGDLWERRMRYWFTRKSTKEASEEFVGILLTMDDAQSPSQDYGRMSLNLETQLGLISHIHSFAATMPKAMADTIQDAIDQYELTG